MNLPASSPVPVRSLELSQKMYQRLLRAYPRAHREEYGPAMAQLFRDQCRDAWSEGRTWGLAALWLRILPDLVKTSFLERWSNFNPGKFMTDTLNALRPRKSPTAVFVAVFLVVFLITLIISTAITFILPETWASTARIKVEPEQPVATSASPVQDSGSQVYDPYFVQTTFEIMQSQVVLSNVVSTLNLNEAWGRKYYGGRVLKTTETMDMVKRRLELKTVRNTKLISITAYSDDREEAAALANAVGKAYQKYRLNAYSAAISQNLASLQSLYQQQNTQIAQSGAEKDRLAKKSKVVADLPADLMTKYQSQLIDGQRAFQALKQQLERLQAINLEELPNVLPTITGDASLSDLLGKLNEARQQLASFKDEYAPANPHIVQVTSVIDELNGEINARVAGIMAAMQSEVAGKQSALEALQSTVAQAVQNSKATPENQPYWDKKNELDQLQRLHSETAARIDEAKLNLATPPVSLVEFTDQAVPGDGPVKPNKALDITLGAILGILLGTLAGSLAAFLVARMTRPRPAPGTV